MYKVILYKRENDKRIWHEGSAEMASRRAESLAILHSSKVVYEGDGVWSVDATEYYAVVP